ncbi:MAG: hypothetical protein CMK23_07895 [Porticoccaceae bacterium]|nr:hypothetical protein [Porticoccaceae bacterium]
MKVTSIRYFETNKGIGYQCKTNIEGIQICNDGVGGATYLDGAFKYTKNFDHLSELDLEDLIDQYENE